MSTRLRTLTLATALAALAPVSLAQSEKPEYGIKADQPETGSSIRRKLVEGSRIPVNKTYAQLTEAERNEVKGWYEAIPAGDEPPFPADGLRPLLEAFGKAQQRLLVTGELFLIATVDATGKVVAVKAIGAPSPEMVKFGASVLLLTKFKPAVCGGSPCSMDFPMRQTFRVE